MPNWEYLQVAVSGGKWVDSTGRLGELPKVHTKNFLLHNAASLLNQLDTESWELTGVAGSQTDASYTFFFKRPKP